MSLNLSISEDTAKRIITAAILQSMGEEERSAMITQAIAWLGEPRPVHGGYNAPKTTPLQDAYANAMSIYIDRVVREVIDADEALRASIEQQLREFLALWQKALDEHGAELRSKVTETVISYVTERQRGW